jgi:hypothetical protein
MEKLIEILNAPIPIPSSIPFWVFLVAWLLIMIASMGNNDGSQIKKLEARIERIRNFIKMSGYDLKYRQSLLSDEFKQEHPDSAKEYSSYQG